MKVLFLTLYPEFVPSSRFRVHQFLDYLKKNGINYVVHSAISPQVYYKYYASKQKVKRMYFQISEFLRRLNSILSSNRYDLIFLQKGILSISLRGMNNFLFLFNKNIVFDFDDAVYLSPPQRIPGALFFLEDKTQVHKIIKRSKAVIAGNKYLAEAVSKYNNKIYVIPTSVDTDYFSPNNNIKEDDRLNIFWSGNRSGNYHLNDLGKVISELRKKYKIKFIIQSDSKDFIDFSNFYPAEVIFKPWSLKTELSNFQSADIGIMPMHDTLWERGKCAFKALLYMSVGIPVVCSPVGVNKEIIQDGLNGFLANSTEEWLEKLSLLIENPDLRKKLGIVGRKMVEERYSLKINAPKLKKILEEVGG